MSAFIVLLLLGLAAITNQQQLVLASDASSSCAALPAGHYPTPNSFVPHVPPPDNSMYKYTLQPDFLTCQDVQELNAHCVSQLNKFRAGEVNYTNNAVGPGSGNPPPLTEAVGNRACQAESAMGEFGQMAPGCVYGLNRNMLACPAMQGNQAQNTCCPRYVGKSLGEVKRALDGCLQQMWDRGVSNGGTAAGGVWANMLSETYTHVSCGFAFARYTRSELEDVVYMSQYFASAYHGDDDDDTEEDGAPTTPVDPSEEEEEEEENTAAPIASASSEPPSPPLDNTTAAPSSAPSSVSNTTTTTSAPTKRVPTRKPTRAPTAKPTRAPTTKFPTKAPTTRKPTKQPTRKPTKAPTTRKPTKQPTSKPSRRPTTRKPTRAPTSKPTRPTKRVTLRPTKKPTTATPTTTTTTTTE